MSNKKKIIIDMILNITSSAIPVFLLQLVIYPMMSQKLSQGQYGNMISTVSVIMVISASLGNVLNNARLLLNENYREKGVYGDFNRILIIFLGISVIATAITLVFLSIGSVLDILLSIIIGCVLLFQGYIVVAFRIDLNFRKILISNICLSVGYILGYLLFANFECRWQIVYIVGYLFSIIYIIKNSSLVREPISKTEFYSNTTRECRFLLEASVIGNLLNYSDRIIINPIIGSEAVTIYYISTLFGKLISQIIGPISGVILGYLAKIKSLEKKLENCVIFLITVVCLIGYFCCVLVAKPVLTVLYPQYYEQAMEYIPITTATAMFTTMASALLPFVLKFCPRKWQVFVNGVTLAFYVMGALVGYYLFDMKGLCVGILLAFMIKSFLLFVILKKGKGISEDEGMM